MAPLRRKYILMQENDSDAKLSRRIIGRPNRKSNAISLLRYSMVVKRKVLRLRRVLESVQSWGVVEP